MLPTLKQRLEENKAGAMGKYGNPKGTFPLFTPLSERLHECIMAQGWASKDNVQESVPAFHLAATGFVLLCFAASKFTPG